MKAFQIGKTYVPFKGLRVASWTAGFMYFYYEGDKTIEVEASIYEFHAFVGSVSECNPGKFRVIGASVVRKT